VLEHIHIFAIAQPISV